MLLKEIFKASFQLGVDGIQMSFQRRALVQVGLRASSCWRRPACSNTRVRGPLMRHLPAPFKQ